MIPLGSVNILSILFLGLLLGVRHATDADHVVAVSTIVSQKRKISAASLVGILWGIGHTVTIFIVGTAIIAFNVVIPPRLGLFFEFTVALALIVLGILNLTGVLQRIMSRLSRPDNPHAHFHTHDHVHMHVHMHKEEIDEEPRKHERIKSFIAEFGLFHLIRPLVVGLVHGLAGSAAIALLVLSSVRNPTTGILYLLIFGLGTIIGMMVITMFIGGPIVHLSKKYAIVDRFIVSFSGLISIVFGLYLAYQIGIVDGLFTMHPQWSPK